jgi:adenylate cyclase
MSQRGPVDDSLAASATAAITRLQPESAIHPSLAKVRHDLRTPINHIIGYAEILQEEVGDKFPADFITDLEKIRSGGHMLLSLINQHFSEDFFGQAELDLHALGHRLRTPVNHIIGYGEMLAEQCDEAGRPEPKPDLAKIVSAAHSWLELMEENLDSNLGRIPAKPVANSCPSDAPSALQTAWLSVPIEKERPSFPRGHLLLADDDEANRDLLRRRLEKLGYRVTACADGCEALRLALEAAPDLVLLDMLMPVLNGNEVLTRIKSDAALRHLPVIMISALDQIERIADCIELGAEDYLAKPFNPVLLRARVSAALEKKRLRDAEQLHLRQIEEERARSNRLLLNILPRPIADRLKSGETRIVNSFKDVTVLFADLVGFTTLSTQIPPASVVQLLDQIFSAFDELAVRHRLEKIKTIGDAYMAAAGIPFPHHDHASAAAKMACDMHEAIEKFSRQTQTILKLRIGICTGPVIAGIIGQNKFIYDLWGDTVNTASRMESHGVAGTTQVAQATYELLRDRFQFEERGTIEIKGKGLMKTYFLCDVPGLTPCAPTILPKRTV